ncbi:MAG: aldehyde dehydrogenase EutE [Myxococcales bacterium]|nr:aldehyde dehydrogenase EutE [Myxococcales bacterium]
MATLDERRIQEIVERVVARLGTGQPANPAEAVERAAARMAPAPSSPSSSGPKREVRVPRGSNGIYPDVDSAVKASRVAFEQHEKNSLELREKIVGAMRAVTLKHVKELAQYAWEETGLGRVEDKIQKNTLCATKTPGTEILRPIAFTGDGGLTITERAPFGVIGSITPTTNPTETIINNGIGMVAGGNSVVYNVHPGAARTSMWHVHILNEAIQAVGGPRDLLTCVEKPTIESAGQLMKHKGVRILVVTGGPAVVNAAMASGKRAICGGPGNPPVVVDETAHLEIAARGIVAGASFDNNVICTDEKEVFAVASICDELKKRLVAEGCYLLNDRQTAQLEKVVLDGDHVNKAWVGKNAGVIAKEIGVRVGDDCRLLIAEVPEMHPFVQHELLMPVIGIVRMPDVASAIAAGKRAEHGFGHTASMYSTNLEALHAMARTINTSIFIKNAPNYAGLGHGGEGYTSFTIASPTGEGLTTAVSFTRERRCTLKDYFRFV